MAKQPLDRGRICFVAEKFDTGQMDDQGNPERKARYAQVGRATLWPAQQAGNYPDIMLELDSAPMAAGPVKLYVFWDSRDPNKNGQNNWGEPQDATPQMGQPSGPRYGDQRR